MITSARAPPTGGTEYEDLVRNVRHLRVAHNARARPAGLAWRERAKGEAERTKPRLPERAVDRTAPYPEQSNQPVANDRPFVPAQITTSVRSRAAPPSIVAHCERPRRLARQLQQQLGRLEGCRRRACVAEVLGGGWRCRRAICHRSEERCYVHPPALQSPRDWMHSVPSLGR